MNVYSCFSSFLAFCKHVNTRKNKPFLKRFSKNTAKPSRLQVLFTRLHFARKQAKQVLKGDFYGLRGCCRTCLREHAEPVMCGFRKFKVRNQWVCVCFECLCRRCVRRVYGKCMA